MAESKSTKVDPNLGQWVSDFLWHWESSDVLCSEAATLLLTVLQRQFQASLQSEAILLPSPKELLQASENLLD